MLSTIASWFKSPPPAPFNGAAFSAELNTTLALYLSDPLVRIVLSYHAQELRDLLLPWYRGQSIAKGCPQLGNPGTVHLLETPDLELRVVHIADCLLAQQQNVGSFARMCSLTVGVVRRSSRSCSRCARCSYGGCMRKVDSGLQCDSQRERRLVDELLLGGCDLNAFSTWTPTVELTGLVRTCVFVMYSLNSGLQWSVAAGLHDDDKRQRFPFWD